MLPSPSHHPQGQGAWTRHRGPLDHPPQRCPYPQSCSLPHLHYSRTPLYFASFSQHFRLPCSSTMPVWTWRKSMKVRQMQMIHKYIQLVSTFSLLQWLCLMTTGYRAILWNYMLYCYRLLLWLLSVSGLDIIWYSCLLVWTQYCVLSNFTSPSYYGVLYCCLTKNASWLGYAWKHLDCTTASEGKSLYSCSKLSHWEAGWKAGHLRGARCNNCKHGERTTFSLSISHEKLSDAASSYLSVEGWCFRWFLWPSNKHFCRSMLAPPAHGVCCEPLELASHMND